MEATVVLIISNRDEVVGGIQNALATTPYPIKVAPNSGSAKNFLATTQPELVLVELGMLGQSGKPFYTEITEHSPLSATILLCDVEEIPYAAELVNQKAVADYFIARPLYDTYRLPIMIQGVLEKRLIELNSLPIARKDRKSVLVIEDNEATRELIEEILACFDYEVRSADTASRGFELAHLEKPDVILLDIMLPGMSGLEALQTLKQNLLTKEIPVIMITSLTDKAVVMQCIKEGCADYITKPFTREVLEAKVRKQIR